MQHLSNQLTTLHAVAHAWKGWHRLLLLQYLPTALPAVSIPAACDSSNVASTSSALYRMSCK